RQCTPTPARCPSDHLAAQSRRAAEEGDMTPAHPQNRVVLVTGASSGIGQAIAAHLAAVGYRVFGTSRSATRSPQGVEMISLDVDDEGSVSRALETVTGTAGRLD